MKSIISQALHHGRLRNRRPRHRRCRQHAGQHQGRPVQLRPMGPKLKPPTTKRLKLECDDPLSSVAFSFNLRRHIKAVPPDDLVVELQAAGMTEVGRYRSTVLKPVLIASLGSALETITWYDNVRQSVTSKALSPSL